MLVVVLVMVIIMACIAFGYYVYVMKNQNLDEGEFVKYIEIPYELAIELMNEGLFMDSNSYIAFSKANNYLEKKLDLSDGKGRRI